MKKIICIGTLVTLLLSNLFTIKSSAMNMNEEEIHEFPNTTVYIYDSRGHKIKTYSGNINILDTGNNNKILFYLNNKQIIVYNATVIIEEM